MADGVKAFSNDNLVLEDVAWVDSPQGGPRSGVSWKPLDTSSAEPVVIGGVLCLEVDVFRLI